MKQSRKAAPAGASHVVTMRLSAWQFSARGENALDALGAYKREANQHHGHMVVPAAEGAASRSDPAQASLGVLVHPFGCATAALTLRTSCARDMFARQRASR